MNAAAGEHGRLAQDAEQLLAQSAGVEGAPGAVLIVPWGEVASANGSFVLDAASAASAVAAFAAHGTDLPIDYEHQSLGGAYASPSGQAPAAGWIRALRVIEPSSADADHPAGLWADVEWTPAGREKLVAREYRYLSPVVIVRKHDRRVVALHSAALTNKPAIVGMRPIVNRAGATNLGEAADESVLVGLRTRLGLGAEAGLVEVLAAADARLIALDEARAQREAEERVASAARAGKLPESLRGWALQLALRDPASFDEWAAAAPVVMALGRTEAPQGGETGERRRATIAASARAVYRSEPALAALTSEEAFVADALKRE